MKLIRLVSLEQFRRETERWDDLWLRSRSTLPTTRADLTAQWIEHFAPQKRFAALVVEDQGDFIAALPLVAERRAGSFAATLPRNEWCDAGDLLLDEEADSTGALTLLARGLRRSPWSVLHGGGVEIDSSRWERLLQTLSGAGHATAVRPQYDVGLIDIVGDWSTYEASLSGNHRRAVRKSLRKLEANGPVDLVVHRDASPADAAALVRSVFEVEDKSWKGEAGTSVLRVPGMLSFFQRQAKQLAAHGELEILFLQQNGHTLAAEYGFVAKGVYHSHKIAYDPEFAFAGPGRLLRALQLQQYFAEGTYETVDTLGILSEANAKWSTRQRTVGRVVISTGGAAGNCLVSGYASVWPRVKKLLRRKEASSVEKLGAEELVGT
jgi:CelD/BcsL family acetyltransferase involved in cellulose biosynthesis